jgi:hypothetical protein
MPPRPTPIHRAPFYNNSGPLPPCYHPCRSYRKEPRENVNDEGLEFEPIHRVLFGLKTDIYAALRDRVGADFGYTAVDSTEELVKRVDAGQAFLDPFLKLGIYVPGMEKGDLFKTVVLDGALPRKTFSMGEAREKRFYMEARKIA